MNTPDAAAGGPWTSNVRVNDVPSTATSLGMAVDAQGNVYVLWMDIRSGEPFPGGIYFSLRDARTGVWSTPGRVSDALGQRAGTPLVIGADASGNAYATWLDDRAGTAGYDLFFSRRDAATGVWSPNAKVNGTSGTVVGDRGWPALAVDPQGNAFAVWVDSREAPSLGEPVVLFSAWRDGATGEWAPDQRFSQAGEVWGSDPRVAVDSSGKFYAIWVAATGYQPVGGGGTIAGPKDVSKKFSLWQPAVGAVWGPGAVLPQDCSTSSIAVDAQGNVHGVTDGFFSLRDAATGACGTAASFREPAKGEASGPSVALDAQGNDWVAWRDTRNQVVENYASGVVIVHGAEIWSARRQVATGTFGPNMRVDDHTVGSDREFPRIGIDQRGNVYAAWLDFRDNPSGLPMPNTGAGDIYFSMALAFQSNLPLMAKGSVAGW